MLQPKLSAFSSSSHPACKNPEDFLKVYIGDFYNVTRMVLLKAFHKKAILPWRLHHLFFI